MNVYNEIDPYAVQWLKNLGAETVLEKSIADVSPSEVAEANRFHTFAGIGLWEHALRLADWPLDVPVWTGSCPCQPFSVAGKRRGTDDERHLWPDWLRLIAQCRPPVIFGEQVASPAGRAWLDTVSADLEALGYAVGAADLCAAGVGAPHIRQRLWFVAYAGDQPGRLQHAQQIRTGKNAQALRCGETSQLGHTRSTGSGRNTGAVPRAQEEGQSSRVSTGDLAHEFEFASPVSPWADVEWLECSDNKTRPVEPGTFPLVDGGPGRVGKLRAYGNAIVPQAAATFIAAAMEVM